MKSENNESFSGSLFNFPIMLTKTCWIEVDEANKLVFFWKLKDLVSKETITVS